MLRNSPRILRASLSRIRLVHQPPFSAALQPLSNANGEKELYDLDRDPYELRRSYHEAGDALKDRLRGRFSSCAGVPAEGP